MFTDTGQYEPCGIFTRDHFILIIITTVGILFGLKFTVNKSRREIENIIKHTTVIACILEIVRILYSLHRNPLTAVNTYLPLYYCSILLYAGIFFSFGKGILKKIGEVALASGLTIGGIVFLIYPSTSLLTYPALHFLSIHSFLFHGTMIYLGILINKTGYIKLSKKDIKYFAVLIGVMSIIAFTINRCFDGNLMFISSNFPNTPIETIYKVTHGGILFSLTMTVIQITAPFYLSYYISRKRTI